MQSDARSPQEYMDQLPPDRQEIMKNLRAAVLESLPQGLEETMLYGMICYVIPHSLYPKGYHADPKLPITMLGIASQKNHIALYHMGIYASPKVREWFMAAYEKSVGKKPDVGKSCIRLRPTANIPCGLLGELCSKVTVEDFLRVYEQESGARAGGRIDG